MEERTSKAFMVVGMEVVDMVRTKDEGVKCGLVIRGNLNRS